MSEVGGQDYRPFGFLFDRAQGKISLSAICYTSFLPSIEHPCPLYAIFHTNYEFHLDSQAAAFGPPLHSLIAF